MENYGVWERTPEFYDGKTITSITITHQYFIHSWPCSHQTVECDFYTRTWKLKQPMGRLYTIYKVFWLDDFGVRTKPVLGSFIALRLDQDISREFL